MSLEGNLSAFGISEILQLVAVQQKSGMLSISSRDRSSVLFFKDGMMVSTRDRRRRNQDPLKDYLVRYGIISREDLLRLTNLSQQSKLDLTEVIVSEGVLDEDEMRLHYRNQIQEAVHEVLTWEQCSYKFVPGTAVIDGLKSWGEFQIESMLMESMRRIDEFPAMVELYPTPSIVVARSGALEDLDEDVKLTTNERTVFALLDKERTISHLISVARMPKYETYEALKHLHDKGLVAATNDDEVNAVTELKSREAKRKGPRRNPLPVILAVGVFAASLAWGANDVYMRARQMLTSGMGTTTHGEVARNRVESKLRWTLEAYRAEYGEYPASLDGLSLDGVVSQRLVDRAKDLDFRYHLTEGGRSYTLL